MPKDQYGHHRIFFDEQKLNEAYERMMDEVYLLYHTHPTNLIPISLSEAEIAECSEYDAMGRGLARAQTSNPDMLRYLPTGAKIVTNSDGSQTVRIFRDGVELAKKTVYPRDNQYHNGLPVDGAMTVFRHKNDTACIMWLLLFAVGWIGLLAWVVMR